MNAFVTVVTLMVGAAQLLFFYNVGRTLLKGKVSERNPWKATTLEWQTPDFPPGHGNFGKELPVVHRWAYEYSVPGVAQDYVPQDMDPDQIPRVGQGSSEGEAS